MKDQIKFLVGHRVKNFSRVNCYFCTSKIVIFSCLDVSIDDSHRA
jgi:hypothetical protein